MGKKYIIDLNPDCVEGEYLRIPARIAGEEQWLVTKAALTPYTEPDLERVKKTAHDDGYSEGYQAGRGDLNQVLSDVESDVEQVKKEAYEDGYKTAKVQCNIQAEKDLREVGERHYQKGLSEAWDAVRKIYNFDLEEREELFHDSERFNVGSICEAYSASEAIEKIRQYEQEQQIQVGDEVRNIENGWIAVVSNIDGECMTLMDANGALGDGYHVNRFTKTGRHFPEIATVLEKMRGEQDG